MSILWPPVGPCDPPDLIWETFFLDAYQAAWPNASAINRIRPSVLHPGEAGWSVPGLPISTPAYNTFILLPILPNFFKS